ncbi:MULTISPECIES: hypothetical protein [unclassified Actinoplanes]|uniref:hypothetical protein n=1 Tax=unclassified Actinoplanes TaxID=2626549 RepID=UPI00043A312E|nr:MULTISPECIES: hypothetical protein [unclassified Actinoplanes]
MNLHVAEPRRPGLRVEVTAGRRLLLRQGDRVVLLGRQRAHHRGVHYCRTGRYESPLPPITARQARGRWQAGNESGWWAARWTYRYAAWLRTAFYGPLHAGSWTLAWGMPEWTVPGHWSRLHDVDPDQGHITWFGYGDPSEDARDILPLRRLSAVDADRVKAYRRQHREGILPPVLLWWVSGLATLLVVDGHDRLTAALAEGAVPDVVVLAPTADPRWVSAVQRHPIREYEQRIAHLRNGPTDPFTGDGIAHAGHRLAANLSRIALTEGRTRAWPMLGGRPTWDHLVAEFAPGSPLEQER